VGCGNGKVLLVDAVTTTVKRSWNGHSQSCTCTFDEDGDLEEAGPTCTPRIEINCVAFSPDGKILAAGLRGEGRNRDQNGSVRLYDTVTGDVKWTQNLGIVTGNSTLNNNVTSISYSPAGDMIAAGCKEGKIYFLDTSQCPTRPWTLFFVQADCLE
jgi:WD40 repeat protein